MIKKNDEIIATVYDIGTEGEGVIKQEGLVIFAPFSLPKEIVRCKILKAEKNYAFGKVTEIITPSSYRVEPKCKVFTKCGGCQLQHLRYDKQLETKKNLIENCFLKIANINVKTKPTVKSEKEYGYRNKLQLPVQSVNGKTEIGFYANNSHRIIPITSCPINPKWTENIIKAFSEYFNAVNIVGYDEEKRQGDVREITVKEIENRLIITLVIANKKYRNYDILVDILKKELGMEFTLYLNFNDKFSNVIYGEEFTLLYGKPDYVSYMNGIKYKTGVRSFSQVNTKVCEKLYSAVADFIKADENTTVIDAYSGAGLMTAILSLSAKKAIGIEIIKEAVDIANELATDNNLKDKITSYCGKCEEILPNIVEKEKLKGEKIAVVLDPPRKGCDIKVIDAVKNSGAEKIAYISCMPSTLARDIGLLTGSLRYEGKEIVKTNGADVVYEIESITPFDMFPQTKHVETVCLLRKK